MPSKVIKLAVPIATVVALALPAISTAQPTTTNQAAASTTSLHANDDGGWGVRQFNTSWGYLGTL
jgi:hypothetical protein